MLEVRIAEPLDGSFSLFLVSDEDAFLGLDDSEMSSSAGANNSWGDDSLRLGSSFISNPEPDGASPSRSSIKCEVACNSWTL